MKEASFVIGYADAAQAVDDPDTAKQVFTSLREEVKKLAAASEKMGMGKMRVMTDFCAELQAQGHAAIAGGEAAAGPARLHAAS